jgi:hypothetical protein
MEYNTSRNHLTIPEYGRNVQKMIEFTEGIEDREERNKAAKAIIEIMGALNPQLRDMTDFKHKLWDHLFVISNFRLDVDSPYPKPAPDQLDRKPQKVNYPSNHIKFKHYGKTVEQIIDEIKKMPEGEEKDSMIGTIANFMKMSYLNHNRDTVSDELIAEHLDNLSKGELKLPDNMKLSHTSDILLKSVKAPIERKGRNNLNRKSGKKTR